MKKYKFSFGASYELSEAPDIVDAYALNGVLVDDQPAKGKLVGYVHMEDGSCVECYTQFNKKVLIIPIVVFVLAILGLLGYILFFKGQNIAVGDAVLRINTGSNTIVFNGIPSYSDGSVDLRFANGKETATISISGDGIKCTPVTLGPGEELYDLPLEIVSDSDVIVATLTCSTDTSEADYEIIIEVPENMDDYTEGISGYFDGEVIIDE